MGSILPARLISALSVALYGMFLAVIIPAAKKNKVILGVVLVSMAASLGLTLWPLFAGISSGTRIIIITVVLSAVAAVLFPIKEDPDHD